MIRKLLILTTVLSVGLLMSLSLPAQQGQGQYQEPGYQGPPQGYQAPPQGYQGPPQGYQGPPQQQGAPDQQPNAGAARVSLIDGQASMQRGDTGQWVAATVNTPLVTGDSISTGPSSRTEVQLDYANVLRLDQNSEARVANLTQGDIQIQVGQGLVDYVVTKDNQANIEIDTPNIAIQPEREGTYRIEVDSPSESRVTIRQGEAQVSSPQGSTEVKEGETIIVQGTDNPEYQIVQAQGGDDWDSWNQRRDQEILQAQSWQYTNPYYTGSSDLDTYGRWEDVPGYGYSWTPYAAPGWEPYADGSWVWEPDWGWTWVSYEPWGWAPYHYGRWFQWNNGWFWWPGPLRAGLGWYRPLWAPAYVSFFGFGGHGFGLGFGFGSIGWLPIGPRDPFFPWWGRGRGFNAVNVTNINNIRNFDRAGAMPPLAGGNRPAYGSNLDRALNDPQMQRAIMSVPGSRFGQGPVQANRQAVTPSMLRGSQLMAGHLPVVPTRASLSATDRAPAARSIPRAGATPTHFFTRQQPPAGPRPFSQQAASERQMVQGLGPGTLAASGRAAGGAAGQSRMIDNDTLARMTGHNQATASRPSASNANSGWQRFASAPRATPQGTTPAPRGSSEAAPRGNQSTSGWQRFAAQPAPRSYGSPQSYSAPRSYGYQRPPLQLNRPMFTQRAPSNYGGGYRGYSGGGRPSGEHTSSHSSGGHSGGGGHSSGGHSGGGRH